MTGASDEHASVPTRAIADQVLGLVAGRAGPGAEAEVRVTEQDAALTRFANSFIHQNVAERDARVHLRVALAGRWAAASTNQIGLEALRRLVDSTLAAARLRPVDPAYPGLAPAAAAPSTGNWDEATAATGPAERAGMVAEFVTAAGGLETAGYVQTIAHRASYANTAGQRLRGRRTSATVDGIARTGSSDGVARRSSVRLTDLSGARSGAAAAASARDSAEPTELEPGDYEVVLSPTCVADLLWFLAVHGFNGRPVAEGRSFVELGTQQFDASVQLWDDATDSLSTALPYDAEGTPRRRCDLVVDGVSTAVLHDRRTAAAAGLASTGHAVPGGERFGPHPTDLRLAPGTGGGMGELAGRLRHGLLVSDFWYTRILDPRTTVVTGLTRNGVWLVENGEVVRPVRNLRFTQSYLDALQPGAVLSVGTELGSHAQRWADGLYLVPSLHLARWHFTGGASG